MRTRFAILPLVLVPLACEPSSTKAPSRTPAKSSRAQPPKVLAPVVAAPVQHAARVTFVETPNLVCMINDQLMGKAQIPVVIENRTYFGCCPACKDRLEKDPRARRAVDPVSRKPVDKATAVIGVKPTGDVLYFESRANLEAYASTN